jgi:tetratricopeptide (TPR) repeat protein
MEILKRTMALAIIMFSVLFATAQNQADLQKAFSDSYTQEYNKKYSEAIATLTKVYDADSYELNLRLGWLHYENKNYTQSQNYYQSAVKQKPYSVEAKLGLVKPLSALESWDKVMQQYESIIQIDAQNYSANYWAGVLQYNRKKYEAAAKMFEKIVNMYPFDYDGNHMLAWTYLNQGKANDAKILFNKALLIRPADASCLEGLSKLK